jgi:LDH2 family malate/lactate/ureidoglycolate dehydrogenase
MDQHVDQYAKPTFSADRVRTQTLNVLKGWGMHGEDAETTADVLLDSDLRGIDTHGISLLALYAGWVAGGGFDLGARSEVVRDGLTSALIDANGGLGFAVSLRAAEMAAGKAKAHGVAVVPGDIEERVRQERLVSGIPLAPTLIAKLRTIAGEVGVPFVLEDGLTTVLVIAPARPTQSSTLGDLPCCTLNL